MGSQTQNIAVLLIIAVLAVAFLDMTGLYKFNQPAGAPAGSDGSGAAGNPINVQVSGSTCAASSTLTLGSAYDKYTPTTTYTGDFHKLFLNGADKGLYADGTAITVSSKDHLDLWTAFNSSARYSNQMSFDVGCKGSYTASGLPSDVVVTSLGGVTAANNGANAFQLIQNGTSTDLTITFYDDNNQPQSAGTVNALTLGINDNRCFGMKVRAPSNKGFSPNGKSLVVFDYNKTTVSNLNSGSSDLVAASAPVQHVKVPPVGFLISGDIVSQGFEFKGLSSNDQYIGQVCVKSDATNNPTSLDNISATVYDQDWYQDTTVQGIAGMKFGYETNTHTDVGGPNPTGRIYVQ